MMENKKLKNHKKGSYSIVICLLFLAFYILPFYIPSVSAQGDISWPTNEWITVDPEEQELDTNNFDAMYEYIEEHHVNLHSLLVVRNGYIVTEEYFSNSIIQEQKNFSENWMVSDYTMHNVWSCTKSIISLLIGIAIDKGYISGVNQTLYEFFEDYWKPSYDERKKNITIRHLLTHTSGFPSGVYSVDQSYIQESLDESLLHDPGSGSFEYSDPGCYLLSAIINITTGQKTSEFARENLFEPIGISQQDWYWREDYQGISDGTAGLSFTPRAMAKIGILCLNNGNWNGSQVVPHSWVTTATSFKVYGGSLIGNYGYLFYISDDGSQISMFGYLGQSVYYYPQLEMIVVFTGEMDRYYIWVSSYQNILDNYILLKTTSSEYTELTTSTPTTTTASPTSTTAPTTTITPSWNTLLLLLALFAMIQLRPRKK